MKFSDTCYTSMIASAFIASAITVGASAQDECATAVTVVVGVPAAFSTITATPSADPPADTLCAGTFLEWTPTTNDIWMKFTATQSGMADFSTCLTGSYDTSMALYLGSCANLIACNGDGIGQAGCQQYYSRISGIACLAGDVFYCRIGGWRGETGTGSLLVTFAAGDPGCFGATGACDVVHAGFGCDNLTCCSTICTINPLCCDTGWDQACVDLAIAQCGYYTCPPVGGAPANNCATSAISIPSVSSIVNFNTNGATMDGPNQSTCNSGSLEFYNDVWWKVVPIANGAMTLSTCGTVSYDNKLAVYNLGTDPGSFNYNTLAAAVVACNDDGTNCYLTDGTTPYASAMSAAVTMGNTYLIRMGSYGNGETGTGTIEVTLPTSCVIGSGNANEQEPCGSAFNDGCNGAGQSESVSMGAIVAGSFWADANTRDTDFYSFSVAASSQVTVSVKAARNATVLLLSGNLSTPACAGITVLASGAGSCPTVTTYCLNPGTYYAFVADAAFTGNPCGSGAFNDYTMAISSAPAACPVLISGGWDGTATQPGVCNAPGPVSMSLNTDPDLVNGGAVACAYTSVAFPSCSTGSSTTNSYARVFPAGQLTGNISCINFGARSTVRTTASATACGTYVSDIALPSTIGIFADLDGGDPRKKTINDGADGGDLKQLYSQAVLITGGVYRATLNLAQPLCVSGYTTKNLVVIMDCPDLLPGSPGAPAVGGYQIRPGTNTAGPGFNTWCRLGCADGAGQYVLTESLGATFTAQWVVQLNGTNALNCNAPPCLGDYNNDGVRNGADLTTLLTSWGTPGGDITGDGTTNGADLTVLLTGWGTCPN